jgi:transposase-like protein
MNIIQIFKQFPTQKSCIKHLEKLRWGKIPVCVYCGSTNTNPLNQEGRFRHYCNGCCKAFNVTVGTIFHGTHVPLQKWFLLISLMQNAKKGLSSCQAARDIEMNRPTVWSMMHRIRKAMNNDNSLLSGIIEMDETYIGGKPRKDNKKDDDDENNTGSPRGRGTKKTAVVGMVERGGNVKAQSVAKNELNFLDFLKMIRKNINVTESLLVTDEYKAYNRMNKVVPHYSVNHSNEYVKGDIHTNTIESFWAILKRGIMGQFHWVSKKHLNSYIDEFCYRYNVREIDSSSVFTMTIGRMLKI